MNVKMKYVWPYLVFVITIGGLVSINATLIQKGTEDQVHLASTINLAGRQRLLSQREVSDVLLLSQKGKGDRAAGVNLEIWNRNHFALQYGDSALKLRPLDEKKIEEKFIALNPVQSELYSQLSQVRTQGVSDSIISRIIASQSEYVRIMDEIVHQFQVEAEGRLVQVRNNQIWLAIGSGLILFLEIVLLMLPNHRRLIRAFRALSSQRRELLESENKFRSFFENSQGLMCTHDLTGKLLSVNSAGAGLLGYSVKELENMSLFDLVPQEFVRPLALYLEQIKRKKKSTGILNFKNRDGSVKTWMFNNVLEEKAGQNYVIGNAIDITERYRLERDLKNTKERLEQATGIARIGGWELDLRTNLLYWSDETKKMHEVQEDFVPDLDTAKGFYKEGVSREKMILVIERAKTKGESWDEEVQLITAKGREIWIRTLGSAEFEGEECIRLFGTFQNIDEQKKTQLEVSASRKQLADILESASDVSIISTDTNGIIKVFNKGAENLLGYTSVEMVDKQTPAIIHLAEEVGERSRELSSEYNMPIEGFRVFVHKSEIEGTEQGEWTYVRKDGRRIRVSLVISCIRDAANIITGYLGVATDITNEKNALNALVLEKSRLQAFVEHAPAAVAMFDNDIRYIAISDRWIEEYKLFGKQIIGKSHYEVFPEISEEWKAIHRRCLAGSVEKNDEDVWRPAGWDHDQYLSWEVRPWYLFDGSVGGIMMLTQDITEACLQREELKLAKKQAEEASVAKSEFLANMSHEIRTPLNGVIGFTDLLLKTNLSETQKQYLEIVNQSGNALLSIINDILDFSKIEAGKLELDIEKSDIYEIGAQAANIISFQTQNKGLEMLLNIANNLPRFIWVDVVRIKQVLINLLSNAAKFTETGEIELKIFSLTDTDQEEVKVRFEIRDTGIGIHPDKQERIFEAFIQEDASVTKKYGGTGLGLNISNKLLKLMGSTLQLNSVPGIGSTFYFELDLKAEKGEPLRWVGIEHIKRVLVVDDNGNNRLILNQMLSLKEIASDEAKNGAEALALLSNGKKYDVIVMDYHMPVMNGIETIRKIRESFYATNEEQPIILLYSSSSDETVIAACEELDVRHRIIKPIKIQDLYDALSRLRNRDVSGEFKEQETTGVHHERVKNIRVLVVEDNNFNLFLAKTILKRILPWAETTEARNGKEAVAYCGEHLPDIIFMDVQMPEMDGYEATRQIREIPSEKRIPIIALTAGNVKGEQEKCFEAGMDDFLGKPFVENDISRLLDKWIFSGKTKSDPEFTNEFVDSSHFDITRLRELQDGDPAFIQQALLLARDNISESVGKISEALDNEDIASVSLLGHTLKGISLTIGLPEMARLAAVFEYTATLDSAHIRDTLRDLEAEKEIVIRLINEMITTTS